MATTINIADGTDEADTARQERMVAALERIAGSLESIVTVTAEGNNALQDIAAAVSHVLAPNPYDLGALGSLG